ncbi:uncharacterized protein N7498_009374 [Penicillium cinerascens]|uniref:Uncharacterized protein n=1 Tax=Penicillium cinerascens TaxID=70096 RepID=A0A9W9M6D2_9EURO|nr:uncharacterized protein N7498_009374 [Penicillium cinerascens]KAJ5190389.1 hypothetical protein N7498_009374 [Penicillium cinerascens]
MSTPAERSPDDDFDDSGLEGNNMANSDEQLAYDEAIDPSHIMPEDCAPHSRTAVTYKASPVRIIFPRGLARYIL